MTDQIAQAFIPNPLPLLPPAFRWLILLPMVLVVAAFTLMLIVAQIAALFLPAQADLFAPYKILFPGEPETGMAQYPCTLFEQTPGIGTSYGERKVMCVLMLEKGLFRRVSVFTTNGKITGVNFHMRNVRLLDLIWVWGKPDRFYTVGGKYEVQWNRQVSITANIDRRYSVQAPVQLIAITNAVIPAATGGGYSYLCSKQLGDATAKWGCHIPPTLNRH